jgi:hypothetical protein
MKKGTFGLRSGGNQLRPDTNSSTLAYDFTNVQTHFDPTFCLNYTADTTAHKGLNDDNLGKGVRPGAMRTNKNMQNNTRIITTKTRKVLWGISAYQTNSEKLACC